MAKLKTPQVSNFKENLEYFFDLAQKDPLVINRSTERFILMSENEFLKMKEEVFNLQRSLTSVLQQLNGEVGEVGEEIYLDDDDDDEEELN